MFGFEMWEIACLVGFVVGCVLLVRFLFKKDDEIEDRRRHAINAAGELRKIHDDQLAVILEDYAIGDYSGIAKNVADIVRKLMAPNGAVDMRADLVYAVLPALLKDEKYADRFRKLIAQLAPPAAVQAAAQTAAVAAAAAV